MVVINFLYLFYFLLQRTICMFVNKKPTKFLTKPIILEIWFKFVKDIKNN